MPRKKIGIEPKGSTFFLTFPLIGHCYIVSPTKSVAPLGKSADSTGLKLVIFLRHSPTSAVIGHAPELNSHGAFHVSSGRHFVFIGRRKRV